MQVERQVCETPRKEKSKLSGSMCDRYVSSLRDVVFAQRPEVHHVLANLLHNLLPTLSFAFGTRSEQSMHLVNADVACFDACSLGCSTMQSDRHAMLRASACCTKTACKFGDMTQEESVCSKPPSLLTGSPRHCGLAWQNG